LQQSIIHVYHDDLLLEDDDEVQNDYARPQNDDTMEVDDDGSNQATPRRSRRSENTISYEDFTKIRDKIISKLKIEKCKFIFGFYISTLLYL
jgi:hypothetical protein